LKIKLLFHFIITKKNDLKPVKYLAAYPTLNARTDYDVARDPSAVKISRKLANYCKLNAFESNATSAIIVVSIILELNDGIVVAIIYAIVAKSCRISRSGIKLVLQVKIKLSWFSRTASEE
jgi:hypothetical protein